MSGSTGAERIKSRNDFLQFIVSYKTILKDFNGIVNIVPSGSFNSDLDKESFGDIDLIVEFNTKENKQNIKKRLREYLVNLPTDIICEFTSEKYNGRRSINTGEILTIRYYDKCLEYSVQFDNIISLSKEETNFKLKFLNLPAEKQGLIIGLVKVAILESKIDLFKLLGINVPELEINQEYEFNISTVLLQLRKVTYQPNTFIQIKKEVVWVSKDFYIVNNLLYQYNLETNFLDLFQQVKNTLVNPRSSNRIKGLFNSMVTIKSGEHNTQKAITKQIALDLINTL